MKQAVEVVLCRSGMAAAARRRHDGDALILVYHNVVPEGEVAIGDLSLHISQRDFASQLDLLRRTHDVVPLPAVLERRRGGRPRAAITFDDAYRGTLSAGVEELARRRLPATVFVAPAFVGGGTFWWDVVHEPGGLGERTRRHAIEELSGQDALVRAWLSARGACLNALPAHQTCASEEELRSAQGAWIALGSHTWSHPNLTRLTREEMYEELRRPRAWLAERFTAVVDWLAYPYGRYSPSVVAAAREAGYAATLRVDGGWLGNAVGRDLFVLPRRLVPAGISAAGFELCVSGLRG